MGDISESNSQQAASSAAGEDFSGSRSAPREEELEVECPWVVDAMMRKCFFKILKEEGLGAQGPMIAVGFSESIAAHLRNHVNTGTDNAGTKEKTYRKNERKNERTNGRTSKQAKHRAYNYGTLATQQRDLMNGNIQSLLGNVGAKFTGLAMPAAIDATDDAGEDEEKTSGKAAARTKAGTLAKPKGPAAPVLASPPPFATALAKAKAPAAPSSSAGLFPANLGAALGVPAAAPPKAAKAAATTPKAAKAGGKAGAKVAGGKAEGAAPKSAGRPPKDRN